MSVLPPHSKPPPKNDAPPLAGGGGVGFKTLRRYPTLVAPDLLVIYSLSAVRRFPAARALALRHGLEVFPAGVARRLAAHYIIDSSPRPTFTNVSDIAVAAAITDELHHTSMPGDESHAVHLIRCLIEVRHNPILVRTLRWAADDIARGGNHRFIESRITRAFRLAAGDDEALSAEVLADPEREVAA